jgi:hypothetical protein
VLTSCHVALECFAGDVVDDLVEEIAFAYLATETLLGDRESASGLEICGGERRGRERDVRG